MENIQTDPTKAATLTPKKTNEDFNKKQPDPKDPNEKKAEAEPEVPNLDVEKKGSPDDIRMEEDISQDEVKNPEVLVEEAAEEDVKDNVGAGEEKVKRSNEVTM